MRSKALTLKVSGKGFCAHLARPGIGFGGSAPVSETTLRLDKNPPRK